MNSSSEYTLITILIDSSTIILSSISLCLAILLFCFIIYHLLKKPRSPHYVALLLINNMFLALILFFILIIDMYGRMLYGHLYLKFPWINQIHCQIQAYLVLVSMGSIFYSNMLQAIYRLCRVIFHTYRFYQSIQFNFVMIIIQWSICFICLLPNVILKDFDYISQEYHCQIQFENIRAVCCAGIVLYGIPIYITVGCYIYTLRRIRNENQIRHHLTQIQLVTARRDLIVLFRICILFIFMIIFIIPNFISFFIYLIWKYDVGWLEQVQWLFYVLSMTGVTVVLPFISPHISNLWKTNRIIPK
ncbi:hypothetical protein I4U23_023337 [Adineta vaga]|nr:hypothetical protein I4U23_023337 [Adineta vaga]